MKRKIKFNEGDLIASMRQALDHAKGKISLRTNKVANRIRTALPAANAQIR